MLTVVLRGLERIEANEPSSSNYDVKIHQKPVDAFDHSRFAPEFQRHRCLDRSASIKLEKIALPRALEPDPQHHLQYVPPKQV